MRLTLAIVLGVIVALAFASISGTMIATLPFLMAGAYFYWKSGEND
jgi:hypothetical protein